MAGFAAGGHSGVRGGRGLVEDRAEAAFGCRIEAKVELQQALRLSGSLRGTHQEALQADKTRRARAPAHAHWIKGSGEAQEHACVAQVQASRAACQSLASLDHVERCSVQFSCRQVAAGVAGGGEASAVRGAGVALRGVVVGVAPRRRLLLLVQGHLGLSSCAAAGALLLPHQSA